MTQDRHRERAEQIVLAVLKRGEGLGATDIIAPQIAAIESETIERCAKVAAESFGLATGHPHDQGRVVGAAQAAAAIRALKDQ